MSNAKKTTNRMTALLLAGCFAAALSTGLVAGDLPPDEFEPTGDACAADVDGDNSIGFMDLHLVLRNWGSCRDYQDFSEEGVQVCAADLNGDGWVGTRDLLDVFDSWGACDAVALP